VKNFIRILGVASCAFLASCMTTPSLEIDGNGQTRLILQDVAKDNRDKNFSGLSQSDYTSAMLSGG